MNLSRAEVRTEYWLGNRRCDVVVTSEQNGFFCLIENKIGSKESRDQTRDYYDQSFEVFHREDYPKRVYIYLSPDGDPPEDKHFIPLPYQAVLDSVKNVLADRQVAETEMFLLRQFQESLRRSVAMDKETLDLVQAIYETYGSTIDFIYENVEKPELDAADSVWDGKSWFLNIGDVGPTPYSWEDCRQHSFICAGGARRYRNIMQNFKEGDIIYAYASGSGYVGVGMVTKTAVPFRKATLDNGKKLTDLELSGTYNDSDSDDVCDWVVLVEWKKQVEKSQAVRLKPIVPSTASRIYEHRGHLVEQVRKGLGLES